MQRFASVIRLRPELAGYYRALHAEVWPSVLATLQRAHVTNYSIFLRDDTLFSYLEYDGEAYEEDMAMIATDPDTQRWWQLTNPCQEPVETAEKGQWWAPMTEVFHLD